MSETDIAIVGMSGRFPGARDITQYWTLIHSGQEGIQKFTQEELRVSGVSAKQFLDERYQPVAGILEQADCFDAAFFGYSPSEAAVIDPQHRMFLQCAWHALEDAGYVPDAIPGIVGVYAGASESTYLQLMQREQKSRDWTTALHASISNKADFLPSRISYKFNLTGPSVNIQSGCSTSLVAVHFACQSLLTGEIDFALAGGSSVRFPQSVGYLPIDGGVQSLDGHCRPFDHRSSGIVSGNGVAVVVLRRLVDANAAGDHIYAVIRGSAVGNDGSEKIGFTAPSEVGQMRTMNAALSFAGVDPRTVTYIEAHGTATALGDRIEIGALSKVYGDIGPYGLRCKLGSVKANVGHLDATAGVAGLIKAALALKHQILPPVANFEQTNPQLNLDASRLYANGISDTWPAAAHPRRAVVNSVGIGGTNAHIVLEEVASPSVANERGQEADGTASQEWTIIALSALDELSLNRVKDSYCSGSFLRGNLQATAYALLQQKKRFPRRMALLARTNEELLAQLRGARRPHLRPVTSYAHGCKVAFMFPGGGASYQGMARGLYQANAAFREAVLECGTVFSKSAYHDLVMDRFAEHGHCTLEAGSIARTLLSICVVDYGVARSLMSRGICPAYVLGHSVGEYIAAVIAGCMSLEEALLVVMRRGELLDELAVKGEMLSVGASSERVRELCSGVDLAIAAINTPELCTISGTSLDIAEAIKRLELSGIQWTRIPLAIPAHSALLEPVIPTFREVIAKVKLRPPTIPIVSNLTGTILTEREACDPEYWVRQLRSQVKFSACIETMRAIPNVVFVEAGPGKSLSAFATAHGGAAAPVIAVPAMRRPDDPSDDVLTFAACIARLWQYGVDLDANRTFPGSAHRKVPLPPYPFLEESHWYGRQPSAEAEPLHESAPDLSSWFFTPMYREMTALRLSRVRTDDVHWIAVGVSPRGEGGSVTCLTEHSDVEVFQWSQLPETLRLSATKTVINAFFDGLGEEVQDADAPTWLTDACLKLRILLGRIQNVGGHEVIINLITKSSVPGFGPGAGSLAGEAFIAAGKVAAQEFSHVYIRSIDTDEPESLCLSHAPFCATTTRDRQVVVRQTRCWASSLDRADLSHDEGEAVALREGGVYVLVGGSGTVGQHLAKCLFQAYRARIAIFSRTEFDTDAVNATAKELCAPRGHLILCKANVSDPVQLSSAFAHVEATWGEINGVLHLAADTRSPSIRCMLRDLTAVDCAEQFTPKISGVFSLEKALARRRFGFCALFSSNASVFGGIGQTAYAVANAFLDGFARRKQRQGDRRWISANWDGWIVDDEVHKGRRSSLDDLAMAPKESFAAFQEVVRAIDYPNIVVSKADVQPRISRWLALESDVAKAGGAPHVVSDDRRRLALDEIGTIVYDAWQGLLNVPDIDLDSNFFQQGGHSLLGLQLMARVEAATGVRVPFFKFSLDATLSNLIKLVNDMLCAKTPAPAAVIAGGRTAIATLADLLNVHRGSRD
jgi:phthiocerol/phenolphthiocerol synthesis type-I polyketide synthase E